MSFHRRYALRGFFDSGSNDNSGDEGSVTLPENARIYYVETAESTVTVSNFESNAVGTLSE